MTAVLALSKGNAEPLVAQGNTSDREGRPDQAHVLDPRALPAHRLVLYRVARGLCLSSYEAEDLVQETFARVLARPRVVRRGDELRYLVRALRNTHNSDRRAAARLPLTVAMPASDLPAAQDVPSAVEARDVVAAIAAAPQPYRDAVVAVDLLGLSYEQAARRLQTSKATINTRVFRGRAHVARLLNGGMRER